jgi:hypothetical protein
MKLRLRNEEKDEAKVSDEKNMKIRDASCGKQCSWNSAKSSANGPIQIT